MILEACLGLFAVVVVLTYSDIIVKFLRYHIQDLCKKRKQNAK